MKVSGNLVVLGDDGLTVLEVDSASGQVMLAERSNTPPSTFNTGYMSSSYPNVVAVKGQTVYVGCYHWVWAVDISTLSTPVVLSRTNPGMGTLLDLAVYGNELVGATDYSYNTTNLGLVVGVLSDPASPSWTSTNYINMGNATGDGYQPMNRLWLDGSTLYVSRNDHGIAAFDLAESVKPTYKGKLAPPDLGGTNQGMAYSGGRLYVAAGYGTGLNVVNTTDLANLKLVVANPVDGTPHDVALLNGYAYVATGGGVAVIEFTASAPPSVDLSRITMTVAPGQAVVDGLVGAVTSASSLLTLELQNATTGASGTATPGTVTPGDNSAFSGTVTAVPGDEIQLTVTDNASPSQSTTVSLGRVPAGNPEPFWDVAGSDIRQVAVVGNYVVVNGTDRVSLVDPALPWPEGLLDTWPQSGQSNHGTIHDMKVSGDLVVLGDDGLTVLEVDSASGQVMLAERSNTP
ncbi:MAG: hypothetical protein AAB214_09145, partial [Fibrobacterota bacterium]